MENKNKDLEDLLTKYKPSGLDESFNHKINSIFSKNSDDDLAPSENRIRTMRREAFIGVKR